VKIICLFLYDKIWNVRKYGLEILSQLLEEGKHVNKIKPILNSNSTRLGAICYDVDSHVAVAGIKLMSKISQCDLLSQNALTDVSKLIFSPNQMVRNAAVHFIINSCFEQFSLTCDYSVLNHKFHFERDKRQSKEIILALVELFLDINAEMEEQESQNSRFSRINTFIEVFATQTTSIFDFETICELILSGEHKQKMETKLNENQITILCFILFSSLQIMNKTEKKGKKAEKEFFWKLKEKSDIIILKNLSEILTVNKLNQERIGCLTPIITNLNIAEISQSEHESLCEKLLKTLRELLEYVSDEESIELISESLAHFHKSEKPIFKDFIMEQIKSPFYQAAKEELHDFQIIKQSLPQFTKLQILSKHLDFSEILEKDEDYLNFLLQILDDEQNEVDFNELNDFIEYNLNMIITFFFHTHANSFHKLKMLLEKSEGNQSLGSIIFDKPISYRAFRKKIVKQIAQLMNKVQSTKLRLLCFEFICNVILIAGIESVKIKYSSIYFEFGDDLIRNIAVFMDDTFSNYDNSNTVTAGNIHEFNQSAFSICKYLQMLIISSPIFFFSSLAIRFLAIFGTNPKNAIASEIIKKFLAIYYKKSTFHDGTKSTYWSYIQGSIMDTYNYNFKIEHMKDELITKMKSEGLRMEVNRYYSLMRAKNLAKSTCVQLVLASKNKENLAPFHVFVVEFIKTSLAKVENFPLLEVIKIFTRTSLWDKEHMVQLFKIFERFTNHIFKIDPNMEEGDKRILNEFKSFLYEKCDIKQAKRGKKKGAVLKKK
jgi:hypothetical protein